MSNRLTDAPTESMDTSRRSLMKLAALGAGTLGATGLPMGLANAAPAKKSAMDELAILSSNENPFGPSPKAVAAMRAEVGNVYRYARPATASFKEMIAKRENVSTDQVIVANGSSPILTVFADWVRVNGGEIVTSELTYEGVPRIAKQEGVKVIHVPVDADMGYDLDAIATHVGSKTGAVYICNPNNPTGRTIDPVRLKAFVEEAAKTAPVFVDEAYLEMSDDYPNNALSDLVAEGHNVMIARTFSKIYAMAGQRIGYAIAPADLVAEIEGMRRLSNVNHVGLVGAMAAMEDTAYLEEMRVRTARGRAKLIAMAEDLGRPIAANPQGSFIYMDCGMENAQFAEQMMSKGVRVVGARWAEKPEWTRICVGLDHEIEKCHSAAKQLLA